MAFNAILNFTDSSGKPTGNSIKVLECDYGFTQNFGPSGKPTGMPVSSNINLLVESTNDTQFIDWMISDKGKKDGIIEFTLRNNNKRTLEFVEGYCTQYHESFNHLGDESPMHISITIVSLGIAVDGIWLYRASYEK